jgi:hypothetical protein
VPASPTEGPPPPPPPIDQGAAKSATPVSTASIVAADTEQFPARDPLAPTPKPGDAQGTPPAGSEPPPPEFPDKPPGYKGTGRPAGSKTRKAPPKPNSGKSFVDTEIMDDERAKPPVDYVALAGVAVDMTTQTLAMLIGPEWILGRIELPNGESVSERPMIVGPMAKWLEAKEVPDLPPGAILLLALGMYASRRARVPNTREKIGGMFAWAKGKLFGFFRRKKKPAPVQARPQPEKAANPIPFPS